MGLSGSGGQSKDPQQEDRGRLAEPAGVIEEIGPSDGPTPKMAAEVWDRALVALFAVALLGGVGIAMTNAFADAPTGDAAAPAPTATARPALAVGISHSFSGPRDLHPFSFTVPATGWFPDRQRTR